MDSQPDRPLTLYTIGHSHCAPDEFIAHLIQHSVTVLVDVRSVPFSRRFPHFRRDALRTLLHEHGIRYSSAGEKLGGRPQDETVYVDDHVDYEAVMRQAWYRDGIARLLEIVAETAQQGGQVAILCSEGDPRHCHRHHLIAKSLLTDEASLRATDQPVQVRHILRDGTLEAPLAAAEFRSTPEQTRLW
ncbi:MAG: DUF488 domain-containing protein [Anaerolineae bacterium]|nr:DUF488 domain-containing protein [Anaerolineae bacterium]